MSAVPIYVWNGTAWQETGPTIPASPIAYQASAPSSPSTGDIWVDSDGDVTTGSQQFQRFRFVASGGETTISGNDANGATLAYTAGLEQVVLNGAVLVRGHDYTATNGTTITGLSPALVANDVLEVFSFIAFTVANTYTQSQVYTKGESDGLYASVNNFSNTAWTTYTPAIKGENGSTPGSTTSVVKYKQLGKTVFVSGYVTINTMSPATGTIRVSLPPGLSPSTVGVGTLGFGRENQQTGSMLQVNEYNSTEFILRTYANQSVGVNGYANQFSFFYETT
jgi:hypothetical protein